MDIPFIMFIAFYSCIYKYEPKLDTETHIFPEYRHLEIPYRALLVVAIGYEMYVWLLVVTIQPMIGYNQLVVRERYKISITTSVLIK